MCICGFYFYKIDTANISLIQHLKSKIESGNADRENCLIQVILVLAITFRVDIFLKYLLS